MIIQLFLRIKNEKKNQRKNRKFRPCTKTHYNCTLIERRLISNFIFSILHKLWQACNTGQAGSLSSFTMFLDKTTRNVTTSLDTCFSKRASPICLSV